MGKRDISQKRWIWLWERYSDFRRPQLAPSTFRRDYRKIYVRLCTVKKTAPHIRDAIAYRDHLLSKYAAETARRTLVQLQACGRWAMESEMIATNPWEGLPRQIRPARPGPDSWAAFTALERDRIIAAFDEHDRRFSPWVRLMFYTGCRPEEAAALRWAHCASDCSELLIAEARPGDVGEVQATKNGKTTRFPCNARLREFLRLQRPPQADRNLYIIPGLKGGAFDYKNFQERYWKPLLMQLVESGQVAFYLSQYHCRHTWITLALEHLPPQDVAYLARTSVAVIYQHYVGRSRKIVVPEF